jgi:hypothetical protein
MLLQFVVFGLQPLQRDSMSGPKIKPHLEFVQPRIFEEDEFLAMKDGIFVGLMFGKLQLEQM